MLAALASAALIVAGSLAVGQAVLQLCGRREPSWLAGPVGLAILLVAGGVVADLGGRGPALAIVFGCLVVASAIGLGRAGLRHGHDGAALGAAVLAALFAALPFIAAGAVGILGVGLVNGDMASHLLITDWIDERFRPEPVFIDQGYPLGPHALVAGLGSVLGASSIDVFAGLTLALPMLTALVAFGAMDGVRRVPRMLAAVVVALPYLAAAYLAQEAFKEPVVALFVLSTALLLPTANSPRAAIPLGVIAAGTVYVYSFPGLVWLLGTVLVWGALEFHRSRPAIRPLLPAVAIAAGAFVVLIAPEVHRMLDFVDFRALHPDRANQGGLGNLNGQLNPLIAFGVWPTSEFRLAAGDGSLPAVAFYAGALAAAGALVLGAPRWTRRHGTSVPAALATAALVYLGARLFGTVYTSAKALAIAAPIITMLILGGLLLELPRPPRVWLVRGLAVAVAAGTALSSFLVLRQAPVGPEEHMDELAEIRPLVAGEKLLFLGRDDFVLYALRGSKPFTAVKNYYDPFYVAPNTALEDVFAKFDFDSVDAETLSEFPYVLTTRAPYASGPPPLYEPVVQTENYVLWRRRGTDVSREPAERDARPGREPGCNPATPPPGGGVAFRRPPIEIPSKTWSDGTIEDGETATLTARVPRGSWRVSIRYDSTRPVSLSAGPASSSERLPLAELPGNLDYRGPAPFWPAGQIEKVNLERDTVAEVELVASVERPPLAGRLVGANSVAHLGNVALTPAGRPYAGGEAPLPGEGEEVLPMRRLCGHYVDWYVPSR